MNSAIASNTIATPKLMGIGAGTAFPVVC